MDSGADEALQRLKELIRPRPARLWIEGARAERRSQGRAVLRVSGPFVKHWLETRCASELRAAFGGPVEVVAEGEGARGREPAGLRAHSFGAAHEFAARMVRAFVEGGLPCSPLLVLHGPASSGKTLLAEWASKLAGGQVFRLDLARLLAGGSRNLVPRKPIVVSDGVETLAGRAGAQRVLCSILDAVTDRGGRTLLTMRGHPAEVPGIHPALRNRLKGGVLLP
ncbi:MAG: hypothetical protein ACREID_06010, partial [Planctomycetota bacterium]